MATDDIQVTEETLQKVLSELVLSNIAPVIVSYLKRSPSQEINAQDDIHEDELAYLQLILMREAARDVGLEFDTVARKNISAFRDELKKKLLEAVKVADDVLIQRICIDLKYCERVGSNWRGKLLFGSGLALAALLADITGLSLASILYLLSIGYFDELCECKKLEAAGA